HARAGGVPRLINVIADAALVFGYGEEKYEIDSPLVDEVIADLDATGVLGTRTAAEHHATVVPVDSPTAAPPRLVAPPPVPAAVQRAETDAIARSLAAREQLLNEREREIAARERELTEQRRVLAEQYRLLKSRAAEPPPPATGATGAAAPR